MTNNEAYAILHPDTTTDKLVEIEYYAGFRGKEARIKAVEDACIIACEAMVSLALYEEIGTMAEFRVLKGKNEPKKVTDKHETEFSISLICPSCKEVVYRQPYKPKYCKHCGQAFDWSE